MAATALAATPRSSFAAFWRRSDSWPPSLSESSTRVVTPFDYPLVAEDEVREADSAFPVVPSGVVVVDSLEIVRRRPPLPVAGIEVPHPRYVLVIVDSVVACLAVFELV